MSQEPPLVFLRDLADIEPPRDKYVDYETEDIYRLVPRPQWAGLEEEIWTPRSDEHDPQLEKVKALIRKNSGAEGDASPGTRMSISAAKFTTKLARKRRKNPRVKVRMFLNNRWIETLVNLLILWALFMEDVRILTIPKEWDRVIWSLHVLVMNIFFLEIVLRSYAQRGFFGSFYFMLDLLASLSIFLDFLPLMLSAGVSDGGAADNFRAAKSARVGTRIARLVRVIRVIRVLKLMVSARGLKKTAEGEDGEETQVKDEGAPSELSKALQGSIAKRTIVFILVLLGGSVIVDFPPYAGVPVEILGDERARIGMSQLFASMTDQFAEGRDPSQEPFVSMRQLFRTVMESPQQTDSLWQTVASSLYRIDVRNYGPKQLNFTFWPVPGRIPSGARADAYGIYETTSHYLDPSEFKALKGEKGMPEWVPSWPQVDNAWPHCEFRDLDVVEQIQGRGNADNCPNARGALRPMRELRTVGPTELMVLPFVPHEAARKRVPYLKYGEPVFEVWYDTKYKEAVTSGLSILMILLITLLLGVMGYLLSRDVNQIVIIPVENMVDSVTKLAANPAFKMEKVHKVVYETDALKLSLSKIATMLQVGFGEAGNNLVAENLKKGDTVDPMVPGTKLLGAYGFCSIERYGEVLECLGEDILPFTNVAASIVHEAVTENGGQPNRNLGEAFLCVWKPELGGVEEVSPVELESAETKMCDGALTAFRRCVRGIASSKKLQAYNEHEEIVKFFEGEYKTHIGYGLHYGWAIEGAVGTNIKIDCSYLSPNVNLAARLQSATKLYGVNVLMSESFHSKLSKRVRGGLRRIDVVCLKGSSIPMAIYTCDRSNLLWVARKAVDQFGADRVIEEFHRVFEEGMDAFVSGDWQGSKEYFEQALFICPRDKPAKRILMHMDTPENYPDYGLATTPFVAPEGWPGYHILQSK